MWRHYAAVSVERTFFLQKQEILYYIAWPGSAFRFLYYIQQYPIGVLYCCAVLCCAVLCCTTCTVLYCTV